MKKTLSIFSALAVVASVSHAQPMPSPPVPVTSYTLGLLTNIDSPSARTYLGIANSNWSVNTDQFVAGAGSLLNIKSGAVTTNLYGTNAHLVNSVFSNGLLTANTYITGLTNPSTLYVSTVGNDATAVKGDPKKPWATLSNAWFTSANGDTILMLPGTYNIPAHKECSFWLSNTAAILLLNKTNVTVRGADRNRTILSFTNLGSYIAIGYCRDVTFENFTVKGIRSTNLTTWETNAFIDTSVWAAMEYAGCTNMTFRDLNIYEGTDHGLIEAAGVAGAGKGSVANYGRNGFAQVERCHIKNFGSWFNTSGAGRWMDGAGIAIGVPGVIRDCLVEECATGIEMFPQPSTVFRTNQPAIILNNVVLNCLQTGIGTDSTSYVAVIKGNYIFQDPLFKRGTGQDSHTVTNASAGGGIVVGSLIDCTIEGNYVEGHSFGLKQSGSMGYSNFTICNNTFKKHLRDDPSYNTGQGIQISGIAKSGVIKGNSIFNVQGNGMGFLTYAVDVNISDNHIQNVRLGSSDGRGINFAAAVTNLIIANNYLYGGSAGATGILIPANSSGNRLMNNHIVSWTTASNIVGTLVQSNVWLSY